MNIFYLPLTSDEINKISENDIINIARSKFDHAIAKSTFLFIRNASLKCKFDFSECNYLTKCEFLEMFMIDKYDVEIEILSSTWLEILLFEDNRNPVNPSILSFDEIRRFREDHKSLIDMLQKFILSIPLVSIKYLSDDTNKIDVVFDDIEHNNQIFMNIHNFISLMNYDDFIYLIYISDTFKPIYFDKYFNNNLYVKYMIEKLPYLNLFNMILNTNESSEIKFIDELNKLLIQKEGE